MGKEFRFDEEARLALRDGICELAEAVAITLGPRGRNVGLDIGHGGRRITTDGYSIAKEIELKDPFLNMGASFAKEAAVKIKEEVGDGTTTGIVLLRALVQGATKQITAGANPILIKRGMEKALDATIQNIDAMSMEIKTDVEIKNIATVSASGLVEIGEMIAACIKQVGKDGIISIEDGNGTETSIEFTDGMELNHGYISPSFCTNGEMQIVEMEKPLVLVADQKIESAQEILPLLQQIAKTGDSLLIIAEEVEQDALSTLIMNHLRRQIKAAAIKAPGMGDHRKELLEDIAILTGAKLVSEDKGISLREIDLSDLGTSDKIIVAKNKTSILGGGGRKTEIQQRIAQLSAQTKEVKSSYEKERLEERKAKLSGKAALIQVGALTESEMKKKKQSYEDALSAARSALTHGIVPGGGIALLRASKETLLHLPQEEMAGAKALIQACAAPFRQLVSNAGFDASILLEQVLAGPKTTGFNVLTEKVEDLLASGIVDPASVVKNSLLRAASIAGIVFLTDVLLHDT